MKFIVFLMLLLSSCGGGTAGTTQTGGEFKRIFNGQIKDENGQALANALIEVDNQDTSATSDLSGRFTFTSQSNTDSVLTVRKDNISGSTKLENLSTNSSILNLDIKALGRTFEINNLELSLDGIGGPACENKFSQLQVETLATDAIPLLITNQQSKVPDETSCFATVSITANGSKMSGIGAELYFKSIDFNKPRDYFVPKLVSATTTNEDGKAIFEFKPQSAKRGAGFFVIEAPASVPFRNRAPLIINPNL